MLVNNFSMPARAMRTGGYFGEACHDPIIVLGNREQAILKVMKSGEEFKVIHIGLSLKFKAEYLPITLKEMVDKKYWLK